MVKKKLYDLIDSPIRDTDNGSLVMYQPNRKTSLPFPLKRVLVIRDMQGKDVRGGHTHHKTTQLLACIQGSCSVNLDNGKEKATVSLTKLNQGLILYPYVWHTMQDFAGGTILLVLADTEYNEKDYIRNYEDFLQCLKRS